MKSCLKITYKNSLWSNLIKNKTNTLGTKKIISCCIIILQPKFLIVNFSWVVQVVKKVAKFQSTYSYLETLTIDNLVKISL